MTVLGTREFRPSHSGTIAFTRNYLKVVAAILIRRCVGNERMLFDRIDRRILALLQNDGRMTNVELAERVGLTAPPCLRRVRSLEQAGAIRGYHAECDAALLGFPITVFAMVSLRSQAEHDLTAFEEHVAGIDEVRECHMLNGEIDFILKIVAPDLESFQRILTTHLTAAPNVASVKSSLTIRTAKSSPGVPIVVEPE